jgi:hypothetical protein
VKARRLMVFAALLWPAVVVAQTDRLAGRVDARTRTAVTALADSASAAGLPVEPLINKALEGASKGADGVRIVAAVRALSQDLSRARASLGRTAEPAELVAGAAALRAGVAPAFLERLRREQPSSSAVMPLAVMADLIARGVPADTAARAVIALARAGARESDLVAFRQSVERDIALGAPAGAAASVRVSTAGGDRGVAAAPTPDASPGGNPPPPGPRKP